MLLLSPLAPRAYDRCVPSGMAVHPPPMSPVSPAVGAGGVTAPVAGWKAEQTGPITAEA
jgi:hypothetical protein